MIEKERCKEKAAGATAAFPKVWNDKDSSRPRIRARVRFPDGRERRFLGQTARAIIALIQAGPHGVTALEVSSWALRMSNYVAHLRHYGIVIEMREEDHVGGWHGRYVLITPMALVGGQP